MNIIKDFFLNLVLIQAVFYYCVVFPVFHVCFHGWHKSSMNYIFSFLVRESKKKEKKSVNSLCDRFFKNKKEGAYGHPENADLW